MEQELDGKSAMSRTRLTMAPTQEGDEDDDEEGWKPIQYKAQKSKIERIYLGL
jgi:hypothetical protein